MGHKYVKEEDTFSTSANGTVPKPTAQEVTDGKVLGADGTWVEGGGGGGGSITKTLITIPTSGWDGTNRKQTITVDGVIANQDAQAILFMPYNGTLSSGIYNYDNFNEFQKAQVVMVGQVANGIVLQAMRAIPPYDLKAYVVIFDGD